MKSFLELLKALIDLNKEVSQKYNLPAWLSNVTLYLTFFIVLGTFIKLVWEIFRGARNFIRNRILDRDLQPFATHKDVVELNKNYVKTRLMDRTPSDFGELLEVVNIPDKKTTTFRQFYRKLFQEENDTKFYFILGESGLGKTTFLMNLFSKYNGRLFKRYKVKYIPLGHPHSFSELKKLEAIASSTIIFIDGLDEMNNSNNAVEGQSFEQLSAIFWKFRMVVISCRTQFYKSQQAEPLRTPFPRVATSGFYEYDKYYVSPFSPSEVSEYLKRRFNLFYYRKRKKAYKIVLSAINLMVRPFLLKNIEFLIQRDTGTEDYGYSLGIYEKLIEQWIERDIAAISSDEDRANYRSNILPMLSELALISFTKGLKENNYYLSVIEISSLATQYKISIDFLRVRSLLNRDTLGNIKFAHKSVLEYFIALRAIEHPAILTLVRANPSFDVANVFIDEYVFFTKIKPIISNFDGYYFEHNVGGQKQLNTITWSSMYTVNSLYLTRFDVSEAVVDIFRFRKLNEVVFLVSADGIQLSDLYLIAHNCWLELLDTIGALLVELYLDKVKIDESWLELYKNLYQMHMKEMPGDFFNKSLKLTELNAIDKIWLDQRFDSTLKRHYRIGSLGGETPFDLLIKTLYNEELIGIVRQLAELTIAKVRTMVDRKTNITTYSLQTEEDRAIIDGKLRNFTEGNPHSLKKMDTIVRDISKSSFLKHSKVKIYY